LTDVITPKVHQLRKERSTFLEFKKNAADLERLAKLCIASDFKRAEVRNPWPPPSVGSKQRTLCTASNVRKRADYPFSFFLHFKQDKVEKTTNDHDVKMRKIQALEQEAAELTKTCAEMNAGLSAIRKRKEKEMAQGGRYSALEKVVKGLSEDLVRAKTKVDNTRESIAEETNNVKSLTAKKEEVSTPDIFPWERAKTNLKSMFH
jgi:uncharacterized coiled-coil protein SlyX